MVQEKFLQKKKKKKNTSLTAQLKQLTRVPGRKCPAWRSRSERLGLVNAGTMVWVGKRKEKANLQLYHKLVYC